MADPAFTFLQLRYFAAAAELGSMTAAAKELRVSQSAVSTAVAQLEKELKVQLLLRHHARGLTLTAAGKAFHRELRSFLAHSVELAESARNAGQGLVGDLTVGCFSTLAPFRLPGLLSRYEEAYPQVRLDVLEAEHATLQRALRAGECEVAVSYGYDLGEDIERQVIDASPPYAIVAADHRLAARAEVSLAELAVEPMILLDLPHSGAYFEALIARTGVAPVVRHRTTGFETVRALVAHGRGYALLNQRPAADTTYDGRPVVALRLRDEVEPLEIVVAWMRGVRLTHRARAFVGMAKEVYHRKSDA
ncbi:LysR family transcriptional regulator [Paractinoplanes deccanensis]|uniref:LysR family transcriptional regulator n=1 Tax=Paractinoplanes deccanensis TaxID=113561 RepID=A0ABQ3XZ53_9ACTN|nr:LysR family transcriptional regulator [Actinoplanes deccanensis]GID73023.1 LysR family transcriptional regulator [Actinoplanes deccanensis]